MNTVVERTRYWLGDNGVPLRTGCFQGMLLRINRKFPGMLLRINRMFTVMQPQINWALSRINIVLDLLLRCVMATTAWL